MSGRSARSIRNFSLEHSQDLVLPDSRKSTFQHLAVNWNFNVLEMALKTFHFVQGLSRTPLLCSLDISPPNFPKILCEETNLENRQSENPKAQVH